MLNMIIAVVNEIYDRCQMTKFEHDLITRSEMLHDFASAFSCSDDKKFFHIYIFRVKSNDAKSESEWAGKIN